MLHSCHLAAWRKSWAWVDIQTRHLVCEILSPSTRRTDRGPKRLRYQKAMIPTYWIGDTDNQRVEVWAPDASVPTVERTEVRWCHPAANAECVVDLGKLFAM